jgi:hypothetical protein
MVESDRSSPYHYQCRVSTGGERLRSELTVTVSGCLTKHPARSFWRTASISFWYL